MKTEELKDNDIKNLFAGLKIEEPSANFEECIIKNAFNRRIVKQSYFPRFAAMAAMFLFIFSFGIMNFGSQQSADDYANLVDDSWIVNDDDVYGDIIVAYSS